jgi:frataxin-like iron-binding protein CyaY
LGLQETFFSGQITPEFDNKVQWIYVGRLYPFVEVWVVSSLARRKRDFSTDAWVCSEAGLGSKVIIANPNVRLE